MYGSQLQLIPLLCLLRTAPTSTELHNALHQGYKAGMAQCFPEMGKIFFRIFEASILERIFCHGHLESPKCRQVSFDDGAGGPFTTVTLTDNLQARSVLRDGNVSMLSACGLNLDRSNTPRLDYQQVKPTGRVHDGQLVLKLQNCLR